MADQQHRATADEWASVKALASGGVAYSCILELLHRIEALETRNEDDKEAWAARLRRPGRSQGERIASLVKRIEALESTQRAINQPSTNRIHLGLGDTSEITSAPASSLSAAVNQTASEAFRAASTEPRPSEVAAAIRAAAHARAKSNHPEKPDSSLLSQVAAVIDNGTACDREPDRIARDAIRAVTAWMREQSPYSAGVWAQLLEQEAER